jgi:hypothetical protein
VQPDTGSSEMMAALRRIEDELAELKGRLPTS